MIFALCVLVVFCISAQNRNFNAMSLNGITGLYVVPTARLGIEDAKLGFNSGYHMNFVNGKLEDLFQFNMGFNNLFEVAATYVGQAGDKDDDLLIGAKIRLPVSGSAIALGGNVAYNNFGASGKHFGGQFYGVVTYQAELFGSQADTTFLIGKTFHEGETINSDIDFGMGFDLVVLPKYLDRFVHWIVDFSNYGEIARISPNRGSVNTGIRIDMSQIPALQKFNFAIDAYLTDAFDAYERSFGIGATFGMRF
jgi:hypothetical protein